MNNDAFVTRLTQGAVASSLALGWLAPEKHSAFVTAPTAAHVSAVTEPAKLPEESSHRGSEGRVLMDLAQPLREWTGRMEREFRRLALSEAKGTLTPETSSRLEELSLLRERLDAPPSSEEVLLQLKRNRALERISAALRVYVQCQKGPGGKRFAAA